MRWLRALLRLRHRTKQATQEAHQAVGRAERVIIEYKKLDEALKRAREGR